MPFSESLPRGAQGEGLVESPLLGGAGEEEEEEAELEERQLSRSQVRGGQSEAGLRGRVVHACRLLMVCSTEEVERDVSWLL